MTEFVVFFSIHDILNVLAFHLQWSMYISPEMYHIMEVLHPIWPF